MDSCEPFGFTYISNAQQNTQEIYGHTFIDDFKIEDNFQFCPPKYRGTLPNCDLKGSIIDHQPILNKPTCHKNRVLDAIYALVKWPESKPGLLFGIVPVNIYSHPLEVFINPLNNEIPNECPEFGSIQCISVVWSDSPFLGCTLICMGKLDFVSKLFNATCKRYFNVKFGAKMFDENSELYMFAYKNRMRNKRKIDENDTSEQNSKIKKIKLE